MAWGGWLWGVGWLPAHGEEHQGRGHVDTLPRGTGQGQRVVRRAVAVDQVAELGSPGRVVLYYTVIDRELTAKKGRETKDWP